jgi:hypothetical protein
VSPRERLIAVAILSVIVLGGGAFLFYSIVLAPLREIDAEIALVKQQNEKKATRIGEIQADRPRLERWRRLSLPRDVAGNVDLARREYEKYLNDLFRQNGASNNLVITCREVENRSNSSTGGKAAPYSKLSFTVTAHATLSSFIAPACSNRSRRCRFRNRPPATRKGCRANWTSP